MPFYKKRVGNNTHKGGAGTFSSEGERRNQLRGLTNWQDIYSQVKAEVLYNGLLDLIGSQPQPLYAVEIFLTQAR